MISPKPMLKEPEALVTDTSHMPTIATNAATMFALVGLRFATTHHMNGTSTTYTAVRNALIPGETVCKPTVCVKNPKKSSRPITIPAASAFQVRRRRKRLSRNGRITSPAIVKRIPKSHPGGNTDTRSFIYTKLAPHAMVTSRSRTLYAPTGISDNFITSSVFYATLTR